MSTNRVVGDALWRALCPSVDAKFLFKAVESPFPFAGRQLNRIGRRGKHVSGQARAVHTSGHPLRPSAPSTHSATKQPALSMGDDSVKGLELKEAPANRHDPAEIVTATDLIRSKSQFPNTIHNAPTPVIYEALRGLRTRKDQGEKIRGFVDYLVRGRGERPNLFLYEALVTANWDTTTGSAAELKAMVYEMKGAGIEASQGFYHSALRLLAVHPDYLARVTLLRDMQERDIDLKDEGKCSVALAMLREAHYEMALEYLDQMLHDGTEIPSWFFDIFAYVLARHGFVDEALQLTYQRLERADGSITTVPLAVWHYLLDECSRCLHYEGTKFVWEKLVQPGTLNPSDGTTLGVLNTASRHGDSTLATEVIQLFSERRVKLGVHHYEALLECYVQAGDLENAFQVLCIMADAGIQPDQSSTRSIFLALKDSPDRVDESSRILSALGKDHELPIAAVNVLLEALAKAGDMAKSLDLYRQIYELCPSGPNQQTFSHLLEGCKDAETTSYLTSEMHQFSLKVPQTTIDNLIRYIEYFASDGDLDVAFDYLSDLQSANSHTWLSRHTLSVVLRRCLEERDKRVWVIAEEANRRHMEIDPDLVEKMESFAQDLKEAVEEE
ncbi:hypothetical protein BT67DRAFT_403395 [Trichocladium antarcticum]|uniref:Pentatricopeptide repeat protein n=1 Tax=Trichocladium antarcticum TaxID=1450529 RepID=A0AAN6ZE06_9PEZI|nr:hypothetical protein BT67DRAFT_403395 [Trichocladium antarcticum]